MASKEIDPSDIVAVCDTREQLPLDLTPIVTERGTLPTGDYSVKGLEQIVAVERKSLQDLVMCVGRERERFDREMQRILAYPYRLLVVEATLEQIEKGEFRGKVAPSAVVGSVMGWMAAGVPILFTGDHAEAGRLVARFLFIAARRRWREAQGLVENLRIARG